jgi:hypothetical protein
MKKENKEKRLCPDCGTEMEKYTPPGFGQTPKLKCSNPACPGKQRKSVGFGS